ncbi:MAG: acyl-CoA dehydrogenase [Actinobacteria bacterium]|nr:acyl-CoA dehydrogenase [Actinomycetota bacterium]
MHPAITAIHDQGAALRQEHAPSDELGRLTDTAASILRTSGGIRLLQAADHGGFEEDPRVFCEWVRAVAQYNPSAGWIAGVVGVHPWEIALADPRVGKEIYGTDPDTWIASPYAPVGQGRPEADGFRFSGQWQYSTGTDHCDWIVLGGVVVDEANPDAFPDIRHFILPRGDYEIVEDSWHVMGLSGTGSKDIRIQGSFVPDYRTVGHIALADGAYRDRREGAVLYQLPFGCVFSAAIASATLGIARGAIDAYREYLVTRISALGVQGKTDPFQQEALAEAEADWAAAVVHIDHMLGRWLEQVADGHVLTTADRLEFRRNQVRAVQRVLFSVDKLMSRAGSAGVWSTRPLERFWRDLRTGGTHLCDMADTAYTSWANHEFQTGIFPNTFH